MTYTVVDLFAGIGGMTKAFVEEGFKVHWAIDYDKNACDIYKHNYPDINLIQGNITNIQTTNIPDCDILISRFPVPLFSNAKNKEETYHSFASYILTEILAAKQPQVILFESVKALLALDKDQAFNWIIEELKKQGYNITYKVMNAKDYANLPYNKERLYIVGFKDTLAFKNFSFPEAIPLEKSLLEIIDIKVKKEEKYYYGKERKNYNFLNEIITEKNLIYQIRGFKNIKFKSNQYICPPLKPFRIDCYILDDYGIRNLTVQEYLDICGLDKFKIPDKISYPLIYRLLSNSSIEPLVRRIANQISIAIGNNGKSNEIISIPPQIREEIEEFSDQNLLDVIGEDQVQIIDSKEKIKNDETSLNTLVLNVENAVSNDEKGQALEILIKEFFDQVEGFTVTTNKRTLTEEIDIQIRNESNSEFWRKESILFICECKNWNKKAGKNELVIFKNKIENRRGRVGLGFFISWNGFTTTFNYEDLRSSKEDIVIIPINGSQIKEAINSENIEEYIKEWFTEAVMS
ncbi:DNA (cytosine-5-)-methyltransferase [Lysinibacillus capsici]|uniref:DNA (cytosine-5-)-methyltransferase n=1 Tax=Lysinibacillus capsici TaxID=2115968 RepID=UPI0029DE745D|nr:DNA (cytosine-5-)-methyltransferase [Lysinibacillus capsici]WPK04932.1 DNA (cytosine-5-)-methyltransferase [Lysinibacillus capsici]